MLWNVFLDTYYGRQFCFSMNGTEVEVNEYVRKLNMLEGCLDETECEERVGYYYELSESPDVYLKQVIENAEDKVNNLQNDKSRDEEVLNILEKVKAFFDDLLTGKVPNRMLDEIIERIQGCDLPVYVERYVNDHEVHFYYPDGKVEDEYGENFCHGSGLYLKDVCIMYGEKWDIDDDIANRKEYIREAKQKYKDAAEKFEQFRMELMKEERSEAL